MKFICFPILTLPNSPDGDRASTVGFSLPLLTDSDRVSLQSVALLRQRSSKRTIEECLDEVASEAGFRSWGEIERACKYTSKLEARIRGSLCILVERRHASLVDPAQFEPMPLLWEMRKRDVIAWWRTIEDREARINIMATVHRHSRREILTIVPRDYLGLRYIGQDDPPSSGHDLLPWIKKHGFLVPELAWLRGECVTPDVIVFMQEYA